jgi:chromosome segregation ATPase
MAITTLNRQVVAMGEYAERRSRVEHRLATLSAWWAKRTDELTCTHQRVAPLFDRLKTTKADKLSAFFVVMRLLADLRLLENVEAAPAETKKCHEAAKALEDLIAEYHQGIKNCENDLAELRTCVEEIEAENKQLISKNVGAGPTSPLNRPGKSLHPSD